MKKKKEEKKYKSVDQVFRKYFPDYEVEDDDDEKVNLDQQESGAAVAKKLIKEFEDRLHNC